MSQLKEHRLAELVGLGRDIEADRKPVLPGCYVRHRVFDHSFGLVVGYVHTYCHPTQVMVLWSRPPHPFWVDTTFVDVVLSIDTSNEQLTSWQAKQR